MRSKKSCKAVRQKQNTIQQKNISTVNGQPQRKPSVLLLFLYQIENACIIWHQQFCDKVLPALQNGTVDEACFADEEYLGTKASKIQNSQYFNQTLAIGWQ